MQKINRAILLSFFALIICSCSKKQIDHSLKSELSNNVQSDLEYERSKSLLNWISEEIFSAYGNASVVLKEIPVSESVSNPKNDGTAIYDVITTENKVHSLKVFSGPHKNLEFAILKSFSDLMIWIDSKEIAKEVNQRTSEIINSSGIINNYSFHIISTQDLRDTKPQVCATFIQVSNQEKDFICYSENKISDPNNHCRLVKTGNLEFQEFFSHMFGGDQSKSYSFDISLFHSPEQKMFWSILTVKIN